MNLARPMFAALALTFTLIGCEEPKKSTTSATDDEAAAEQSENGELEGTGLPGVLDPKARMDEAKKGYKDAIDVKTKNIERGVERSLTEGGGK